LFTPRIPRLTALLVLGVALLAGCGKKPPDGLRWGADLEGGAPYIYLNDEGQKVGFEVDLANALAKEINQPIHFVPRNFTSLVDDLERDDIDLAMNGLEVTPDREKIVRFSRPYYVYRLQLVARKGEKRFTTLEELKATPDAKPVGTLDNTAASRLLDKLGIKAQRYPDQVTPYEDLALGRLDAVLLDLPIAQYIVKKNAGLNEKLEFIGEPFDKGYYAIAFRKNDSQRAEQFNAALDRLIKNGELKRIYEKWELWNDDQKELESHKGGG
jgi:polar amino acid transport system substrate-binding protein